VILRVQQEQWHLWIRISLSKVLQHHSEFNECKSNTTHLFPRLVRPHAAQGRGLSWHDCVVQGKHHDNTSVILQIPFCFTCVKTDMHGAYSVVGIEFISLATKTIWCSSANHNFVVWNDRCITELGLVYCPHGRNIICPKTNRWKRIYVPKGPQQAYERV
jgi:hypothetical protein